MLMLNSNKYLNTGFGHWQALEWASGEEAVTAGFIKFVLSFSMKPCLFNRSGAQ